MKDPLSFSPYTNYKRFLRFLEINSLIKYHIAFDPDTLKDIFIKDGIELDYMPPGTKEYKTYGCCIMKVINIKRSLRKIQKPVLFNTKMLDV